MNSLESQQKALSTELSSIPRNATGAIVPGEAARAQDIERKINDISEQRGLLRHVRDANIEGIKAYTAASSEAKEERSAFQRRLQGSRGTIVGLNRRISDLEGKLQAAERRGNKGDATDIRIELAELRGMLHTGGGPGGRGSGEGKGTSAGEPDFLKYLSAEDMAKWAKSQAGIKDKEDKKAAEEKKEESMGRIWGKGIAETAAPAIGSWLGFSTGSGAMIMWVVMAALAIVLFVKIMGLI